MSARRPNLMIIFAPLGVLAILASALIAFPVVNRDVKRAFRIPVESSGPHYADGTGAEIPGSADFMLCALSRARAPATCAVVRSNNGWRITSEGTVDPRDCAATCLK